jgi:hypothetical protein
MKKRRPLLVLNIREEDREESFENKRGLLTSCSPVQRQVAVVD